MSLRDKQVRWWRSALRLSKRYTGSPKCTNAKARNQETAQYRCQTSRNLMPRTTLNRHLREAMHLMPHLSSMIKPSLNLLNNPSHSHPKSKRTIYTMSLTISLLQLSSTIITTITSEKTDKAMEPVAIQIGEYWLNKSRRASVRY